MKIYSLLIILYSLSFHTCFSQGVPDNKTEKKNIFESDSARINKVIILRNKIADFNEVQSSHIGYAGRSSTQYENYEKLLSLTTERELINLTRDTNYVVATYATFGLIEKNSNSTPLVFERFLKNDQTVKSMSGCSVFSEPVSGKIYHQYWNYLKFAKESDSTTISLDEKLLIMDSLVLTYGKPDWFTYERIFSNRTFPDTYSALIENEALVNLNVYAIDYLYRTNFKDYSANIRNALIGLMNKEIMAPVYYDKIIEMLLSYKDDELNSLVLKKLVEVDKHFGKGKSDRYDQTLNDYNIKK